MKLGNYTRREALQFGAAGVLLSSTSGAAGAVESVLSSGVLEKRLFALSQCTWEDFDADMISISEQSISIGGVQIEFTDGEEDLSGNDCGETMSCNDVSEILGIIGGNHQQQAFFFRKVLGMTQSEYWLTGTYGFESRQNTLQVSESTGINFASRGDGWGSPNDLLPVRKKIS